MKLAALFFTTASVVTGCGGLSMPPIAVANGTLAVAPPPAVWAFVLPGSSSGDSALRAHASSIAAAITTTIPLDTITGLPVIVRSAGSSPDIEQVALITTFTAGEYRPGLVRRLARDPASLERSIEALSRTLGETGIRTAVIDFDGQPRDDLAATVRVIRAYTERLEQSGTRVVLALAGPDTTGYPTMAFQFAHTILLKFYAARPADVLPAPLFRVEDFRRVLGARVAALGGSRFIVALPVHGYVWRAGHQAERIAYADARRLAAQGNVTLTPDPANHWVHAVRPGEWELWMPGADLMRDFVSETRAVGVDRIALWAIGDEDPAIWPILAPR